MNSLKQQMLKEARNVSLISQEQARQNIAAVQRMKALDAKRMKDLEAQRKKFLKAQQMRSPQRRSTKEHVELSVNHPRMSGRRRQTTRSPTRSPRRITSKWKRRPSADSANPFRRTYLQGVESVYPSSQLPLPSSQPLPSSLPPRRQ